MTKAGLAVLAGVLCGLAAPAWCDGHSHVYPDLAVRIDQALLETPAVTDAERQALVGTKVKDFSLRIKADGLHAGGKYHTFLKDIEFDAVAALVWTGPNVFEVRVRKLKVFLFNETEAVATAVTEALDKGLKGVCVVQKIGQQKDGSQALRVTVDMKALSPDLANLALVDVATRDGVLILKARLP